MRTGCPDGIPRLVPSRPNDGTSRRREGPEWDIKLNHKGGYEENFVCCRPKSQRERNHANSDINEHKIGIEKTRSRIGREGFKEDGEGEKSKAKQAHIFLRIR